jgi:hypothetical protein
MDRLGRVFAAYIQWQLLFLHQSLPIGKFHTTSTVVKTTNNSVRGSNHHDFECSLLASKLDPEASSLCTFVFLVKDAEIRTSESDLRESVQVHEYSWRLGSCEHIINTCGTRSDSRVRLRLIQMIIIFSHPCNLYKREDLKCFPIKVFRAGLIYNLPRWSLFFNRLVMSKHFSTCLLVLIVLLHRCLSAPIPCPSPMNINSLLNPSPNARPNSPENQPHTIGRDDKGGLN